MPLQVGTKLSSYEILAPLGAGGMGEVYVARDTKLNRDVAIKVLPSAFAQDKERVARFRREAQVLASLNHPNIAAIHGLEESEGVVALALELVEGEDLAERLKRGAVPLDEALPIARQIAEALEEAHEHGIVHRDLKPANVKVTPDGKVKVLDFGLAKAIEGETGSSASRELSHSPTMTSQGTEAGIILGTASYMSPEQARGKKVDKRADIWAFGVVVFEMLSGRRLFSGETVSDVLAAVLTREPDWSSLPASTPRGLRALLRRCLDRDPKQRLRDIGEARVLLSAPREAEPAGAGAEARLAGIRPPLLLRLSALVAAVALTAAFVHLRGQGVNVSLDAAHFVPFAVDPGVQSMPAWSPDGQSLAYSGEVAGYYQIFTRQLGQSIPVQLTRFDADCLYPQWDPTGTRVFFQRGSGSRAGQAGEREVWVVSAAGGAPELVGETAAAFAVAPDGSAIVYLKAVGQKSEGAFELWSHDLKTGKRRLLQAVPDRWTRSAPTGGSLRFSPDGARLAFVSSAENEMLVLRNPLVGAGGEPKRVRFASHGGGSVRLEDFSWLPDGRHFAFDLRDPSGGDKAIWLGDVERGTVTRVTASALWESTPAAARTGARIAFSATALDWDILELDLRSGQSRPLVASSRYDGWGEWLPDGSGVLYSTNRTGRFEIWTESFRDHATRAIVTPDAFPDGPSFFLVQGAVSPDARSVAYVRFALNEIRIYVSAIGGSRPVRLTLASGGEREDAPVWSPDGRWILFRSGGRLMKALASGGTSASTLAQDGLQTGFEGVEGHRARWLPDGRAAIYEAVDGLKQVSADGGHARRVTSETPLLWDISPDGRLLYAVLEREQRAIDLATVDVATGAVRTLRSLGRRPLSPDYNGYVDTLRGLRVSPDGTRLMYALLNPTADIWILEGITPPRPWWGSWWR